MPTSIKKPEIHIWGPPVIDWLNVSDHPQWPTIKRLKISYQNGGIYLLEKLLKSLNESGLLSLAELVRCDGTSIAPPRDTSSFEVENLAYLTSPDSGNLTSPSPLQKDFGHTWSTWEPKKDQPTSYRLPEGITSSEHGDYLINHPNVDSEKTPDQDQTPRMLILDVMWNDRISQDWLLNYFANTEKKDLPTFQEFAKNQRLKIAKTPDEKRRTQSLDEKIKLRLQELEIDDRSFEILGAEKTDIKTENLGELGLEHLDAVDRRTWPQNYFEEIIVRFNARKSSDSFIVKEYNEIDLKNQEIEFLNCLCRLVDREKLTVLTKLKLLRDTGERIGESISWEQMLDDTSNAAKNRYGKLSKRVVTTIGLCGAVMSDFGFPRERNHNTLIYCIDKQENDDETELKGRVIGNSTCLLASVATEWMQIKLKKEGVFEWDKAINKGVAMIRALNESGYIPNASTERPHLVFPFETVRKSFFEDAGQHKKRLAKFWRDEEPQQPWTILEKQSANQEKPGDASVSSFDPLMIAKEIVRKGGDGILYRDGKDGSNGIQWGEEKFPLYRVGQWQSADRNEIELVRSVHNMLRSYVNSDESKPISIGIFGPPGSGKSFVVKQITKTLELSNSQLTVNLSQLKSPTELAHAFQRSRNHVLNGKTPVVFWDEFDSSLDTQPLGWLRYFLSPMQDGEFLDNGILQSLGRAIFVFAGGTAWTHEKFSTELDSDLARQSKKRDFVSRLRGYIDVKGPNPDENSGRNDRFAPIRRAFLIHSLLCQNYPSITFQKVGSKASRVVRIDEGVINAFLQIEKYNHGARSIENIIRQSSLAGKTSYDKSCLPPKSLLKMHVNVDEFMGFVGN